jgi:NADH-quinone oxidoreductase subunit K
MTLDAYVLIAGFMFCIGLYGVLTRRNAIGILVSVELMVNAANINLAAFAHFGRGIDGQVLVLFTTALTVAEVVVGLALVLLLFRRRKDILVDLANGLKG